MSSDATPELPSIDLPNWLRAVLAIDPDGDVLHFEGCWRTWSWLARGVETIDEILTEHRLGDGVKVGVLVRNRPEIVRTITATLATRRCLVTLSSAMPMAKLAAEVEQMRLSVVVATEEDWANKQFRAAVIAAGSLGVVVVDGEPPASVIVAASRPEDDLVSTAPGVAVEMLTSGTTGPPKRIDLPYRGLEFEIESTAQYSAGGLGEPRAELRRLPRVEPAPTHRWATRADHLARRRPADSAPGALLRRRLGRHGSRAPAEGDLAGARRAARWCTTQICRPTRSPE